MYVPTFGWLFVGKLVDKCTVRYMDPMGIEGEDILSVPKNHFIILASRAAHQLNLARGWSINQTPVEPQKNLAGYFTRGSLQWFIIYIYIIPG